MLNIAAVKSKTNNEAIENLCIETVIIVILLFLLGVYLFVLLLFEIRWNEWKL
jgi:hypothetical protein